MTPAQRQAQLRHTAPPPRRSDPPRRGGNHLTARQRVEAWQRTGSVVKWLPYALATADQIRAAGRDPRVVAYSRDSTGEREVITITAVK